MVTKLCAFFLLPCCLIGQLDQSKIVTLSINYLKAKIEFTHAIAYIDTHTHTHSDLSLPLSIVLHTKK